MFKYCYNNNGLRNMSLEDSLKNTKKIGYDAIEISFHQNHIHPLSVTNEEIYKVRSFCEKEGLKIAAIAAGADNLLSEVAFEPSLINPVVSEREKRMDLIKKSMDITQKMGVQYLIFASGKYHKEISQDDAMKILIDEVKELLNYNKEVSLLIEPEPDFFIGTSEAALKLIEKIDDDRFKMNLDIGHVYCCEDNFLEAIEKSLPHARHIHIEDIKDRIHFHEIPGEGDIDFKEVFRLLKMHRYEYYISVELYNHIENWERAMVESLAYLKSIDTVTPNV